MRLRLLACLLLLSACGGAEEAPGTTPAGGGPDVVADGVEAEAPPPPEPADLGTSIEPVPLGSGPDVVADIDPSFLLRATLSRGGQAYRLEKVDGRWEVDGRRARVGSWLGLYAPLRADGRATGIVPDSLIFSPDAQVSFFFTDGSGRVVSFGRTGDSLAVVAQPNGPVYRLPPSRLDALVPPAEALAP